MASKTMLHPSNGSLGLSKPSLGRQGSNIFSLTLEEFEMEHGKIGSMNMDEFLKNVWTAEESQAMVSSMTGDGTAAGAAAAGPSQSNLQSQASLCSVPPTLVDKTVEEVWKVVQAQKQQQQQQEMSFGEMTLEDFLVRAGVVKEDMEAAPGALEPQANLDENQQQADWYSYQMKQQQQQLLQQQAEAAIYAKRSPVGNMIIPGGPAGGFYDGTYEGGSLTPASLALSPGVGTPDTPSGKKRNIDLVVEKTVERRQRRMIKNRESAARSRARKQAYTVELEAEVTQLKEENMRLKRWQAEEAERRRKQVMEVFLPVTQQDEYPDAAAGLRRTRSAP